MEKDNKILHDFAIAFGCVAIVMAAIVDFNFFGALIFRDWKWILTNWLDSG